MNGTGTYVTKEIWLNRQASGLSLCALTTQLCFFVPDSPFGVSEDGRTHTKGDVVVDAGARAVVLRQPVAVHVLPVPEPSTSTISTTPRQSGRLSYSANCS